MEIEPEYMAGSGFKISEFNLGFMKCLYEMKVSVDEIAKRMNVSR
jgi:hypothetical protein